MQHQPEHSTSSNPNSTSILYTHQKAHHRQISSNFTTIEKDRNKLIEEEIISNLNSPIHDLSLSDTITLENIYDIRWASLPPSQIMLQLQKLFNSKKFQAFQETNQELLDLEFQNPNQQQTPKIFFHANDIYRFLLKQSYHKYTPKQLSQIKLVYSYKGALVEELRHGYGKLEVIDSKDGKFYYTCYEGLFLCGGFHGKDQIYVNKTKNYWYKGGYVCGHEHGKGEEGDGYENVNYNLQAVFY